MKYRFGLQTSILALCLILTTRSLSAAEADEPAFILEQARDAAKAVKTVNYRFTYEGTGSLAGTFEGSVKLKKDKVPTGGLLWISMNVPETHGVPGPTHRLVIATDGKVIQAIDERKKTFSFGSPGPHSIHLLSYAYYGVLFQFLQPEPFAPELAGPIQSAGKATIHGVSCDVIKATNNSFGGADVWWYIGEEDKLPHAQKWVVTQEGVSGSFSFQMQDLRTNNPMSAADFTITPPGDYNRINEDDRKIAVGEPAPNWLLRTAMGQSVQLSELEGNIVVMDVWASWCPPCWRLMPIIEDLTQKFQQKKVRVFGVNAWESPDLDPSKYAKEKGIHYKILLHGESLATQYKIASMPALFVIDQEGNFLYIKNPVMENPDQIGKELALIIDQALGSGD